MIRRSKTETLGDVLKEVIKDFKIDRKLQETQLINSWEEVIGKTIARATKKIYINNKTLYLQIHSSIIRNELSMIKSDIINRLNQKVGAEIINNISFWK
jgi:hypothetical protein